MEIIWQVENDPYASKVLAKHWPDVPRYGDIKTIDFTTLPRPDLICGGFPCQPVSCAGKRQGDKDERWLWSEFYRAVCEARPRWVLVENVPGLLSADGGRLFGGILGDLARCGYDAEWDLLPAAAFGAPHLRFRLFLVAWNTDSRNGNQRAIGKMADAERQSVRAGFCPDESEREWGRRSGDGNCAGNDSNSSSRGLPQRGGVFSRGESPVPAIAPYDWWAVEPDVGRVAHGIPARVDRLKCLGNAVVPQVAEWIGGRIMEAELI